MTILNVMHGASSKKTVLTFPATPEQLKEYSEVLERMYGNYHASTTQSPALGLFRYIRNEEWDNIANLEKINLLAERVENMTPREITTLTGALDSESINCLDDVLRVAQRLGEYTILPDVHNDRELGQALVFAGHIKVPREVLPYISYERVGSEFYSDHGGAYRPEGYVVRRSELPLCVQTAGYPEPHPTNVDSTEVFVLELEANDRQHVLSLPAEDEYLDEVCRYLGIEGFAQAKILKASCEMQEVADLIPMDCISVEGANTLAWAVEEAMETDGELLKLCSVFDIEQPADFPSAVKLATSLDDYERVRDDPEMYGKQVLAWKGADHDVIEVMEGYMDFEALGRDAMREDGVRRTGYGLVRRISEPFPPEQGQAWQQMM